MLTIGPWDLSLELGLDPRKLPLPQIEEISVNALEVARRHGVEIGVSASTPDGLRERQAQGFTFISMVRTTVSLRPP